MATSVATAQEIYSSRFLKGLTRALAALKAFSTSLTDEAKEVGETVKVPLASPDTVAPWNATSNNFVRTTAAPVEVSVALSSRIIAGFGITPAQMANFRPNWWEGKADLNAEEVADTILAAVAALITGANYGDTAADKIAIALAGMNRKAVAAIRAAAVARKMRPNRCCLVLNPDYFSALLGDLDANVYGGREAVVAGVIPGLLGFRAVVELPQLTVGGALLEPSAIAVATRSVAVADEGPYRLVRAITEPETGLTMTNVVLAHGPDGSLNNSVTATYGVAVGDEDACLRIV